MTLSRRALLCSPLLGFVPRLPLVEPGRALIVVWLDGGMSHVDTFDGKPEASLDIRGDLKCVPSKLEGAFVSAHLPKLDAVLDRCVLLRSVTHGEGNHDRGSHLLLTGHRPSPVLVQPSLGSVLAADAAGALPPYVVIPDLPQYAGPGFLGATRMPFVIAPDAAGDLAPRPDSEVCDRLVTRLDALDGAPRSASEVARDVFRARARALTLDAAARGHFDLSAEKAEVRSRYGRHALGQGCLLARRLVRGGARCVLVRDAGWDHHQALPRALTYGFPPKLQALDEGLSALIEDLDREGLAERTVVMLASEFGRTPRINPLGGRDHWPRAQSVLLFGAGLKRGTIVGSTDARGEEPDSQPVSPAEVHATVLHCLRVPHDRTLRTPDGRPVPVLADAAEPIAKALA